MKPLKRALSVLKGVAPTAVAALGGPLAPVAAGVIRSVLGVDASADLDEAVLAAAGDPNAVVRLREIESQMQAKEQELGVRFEEIAAKDRDSARQRQVALKDRTPAILAYLLTVGFFGTLLYMLRFGVPEQGGDALLVMLGSLGTAWTASMTYFFGSSVGSKAKTDLLAGGATK